MWLCRASAWHPWRLILFGSQPLQGTLVEMIGLTVNSGETYLIKNELTASDRSLHGPIFFFPSSHELHVSMQRTWMMMAASCHWPSSRSLHRRLNGVDRFTTVHTFWMTMRDLFLVVSWLSCRRRLVSVVDGYDSDLPIAILARVALAR